MSKLKGLRKELEFTKVEKEAIEEFLKAKGDVKPSGEFVGGFDG